ncbi:hypothetical protein GCM10007863_34200 [Dyella mobilis]|nr:hypothetical protein GCM10007863_34200 [Dyella mobilis]
MVAWTEGYLSARVSDGVVTDASDVEDIRAFYDDYCKAKPTVTLFDAVNDWIEQRRNEIKYSN